MAKSVPVLLDTHVWIWLVGGTADLKRSAIERIRQAQLTTSVLISAISFWEVAMLASTKRIAIGSDPLQWLKQAISQPGLQLEELTCEVAVESCNMPGRFHGDPADRIIVATARLKGATLITRDLKILKYGQQGFVDVISA